MRIVAFPFHDWRKGEVEGIRWRDGHLIEAFASHPVVDHVLVIDRPVSLAERWWTRRPPFVRGDVVAERGSMGRRARLTRVHAKLTVLDVSLLDVAGPVVRRRGWWFDVFEAAWVHDVIAWASDLAAGPRPAVIAWTPTVADAIQPLSPSRVVFDSLDNWLIHPSLRRHAAQATRAYARLLPGAHVVVASAPASSSVLARWARDIRIIPNGVDPTIFAGDRPRPGDLPAPPVVGYAGSLAARIDAELVAAVARSLPAVQFAFIGRMLDRRAVRPMLGVPNVHVLGNRHYATLPAYLRNFDVAWIPHAVGPGETGGDPIKLYEYWAAGRQVVATPIDGIGRWAHQLHLVRDGEEARAAIDGLLSGRRASTPTVVPPDRTWTAIADEFVAMLTPSGDGASS